MPDDKVFKINRRQLFKSAFGLFPFLVMPSLAEAAETSTNISTEAENTEIWDIIRGVEAQVRQHQGFSQYLHNELRHYYGAVSEEESRRHADIILSHSVMDTYTINTVSEWFLTHTPPDPQQAIGMMMGIVERYPHFSYLRAVCLIKSGEAFEMLYMKVKAVECYRAAKNSRCEANAQMRSYHQVAEDRLQRLSG